MTKSELSIMAIRIWTTDLELDPALFACRRRVMVPDGDGSKVVETWEYTAPIPHILPNGWRFEFRSAQQRAVGKCLVSTPETADMAAEWLAILDFAAANGWDLDACRDEFIRFERKNQDAEALLRRQDAAAQKAAEPYKMKIGEILSRPGATRLTSGMRPAADGDYAQQGDWVLGESVRVETAETAKELAPIREAMHAAEEAARKATV